MTGEGGLAARRAALAVLRQLRQGERLDAALDRALAGLADADRRLAHELAAGVLRRRRALDDRLAPLLRWGLGSVRPALRDVLRLGAYQLTALDRVPPHAAVDTSVALAREAAGPRAGGFVNAVLRRVATAPAAPAGRVEADRAGALGGEGDRPGGEPMGEAARLAAVHSHPEWLVARWLARWGPAATEQLLRRNNTRPRLAVQPARRPLEELAERWRAAGIAAAPAPYGAGLLPDRARPAELPGYAEGDFIVQDPAHALLVRFADFPPGTTVYDACAAPGGKAIALGRAARVVAGDLSPRRARRLAENLRRAGSGREHAVVADARRPPLRAADAVLLDAPCLGTGTFARHPDARWRVTPAALESLTRLQGEILEGVAAVVSPGGLLVYSTCSLEPEENERQVARFLAGHPEFRREPSETFPPALVTPEGDLMIEPHRHGMDGAFAARLRRGS